MSQASPDLQSLHKALEQSFLLDRSALRRSLRAITKNFSIAGQQAWQARCDASIARVSARQHSVPVLSFDQALPITAKRAEIKALLCQHQVVIIAGATGSGKTTQLPKICLELGLGMRGMIGHTQPRRLAARAVATRIAQELEVLLGAQVGYQFRFEEQSSPQTLIKVMTDGLLLAEIATDRDLYQYDTLILDEAHERSLNIDFLLGYLKTLLPRRPDLKLIITSATIDLERFSNYFGGAPIVEVSGRMYPVTVWYRPLLAEFDEAGEQLLDVQSLEQGIAAALQEISMQERELSQTPGDVLVFLPGERDIRQVAEFLRALVLKETHILPLYARLTSAEQQKIFAPLLGRKIVLATNVAETSLTVPGIRYVIDSGTARISRYSYRSKVQRLPIEPIAQASAQQRTGRAGRTEPGICIRLYSEEDFLARPLFTDPEIKRTNLAAVILTMLHLRLGALTEFPFIDPPEGKAITDGLTLLFELGAVHKNCELTSLGKQLAVIPIDPRLARMLLQGIRQGCLPEVLIIASGLGVQDPRERPLDRQQAADQAHAQWQDQNSDFVSLLKLWYAYEEQRQTLSANTLRHWCKKNFLNPLRMREWRALHRQLVLRMHPHLQRDRGRPDLVSDQYAALHKAILSGLLTKIGQKTEEGDYLGVRQRRFVMHPATALYKKRPAWLMAAELVETNKLYARQLAKIQPEWIESLAGHLIKKSHTEPHWEKKRGQVVAYEQITLHGLIIVGRRPVHFGPIDPTQARAIFIQEALVAGHINSQADCLNANRLLLEELGVLEDKARRRGILVDEQTLCAYYAVHLPAHIHQTASFNHWYRTEHADHPSLLCMNATDLLTEETNEISLNQYPDSLQVGTLVLPLRYHFEPGHPDDGVTVRIPAPALPILSSEQLEWLVPGLLEEKAIALVRALPKTLRKQLAPVPDFVRAALERLPFAQGSLCHGLAVELERMTGVRIQSDDWAQAQSLLATHLHMNLEITDAQGQVLGAGRDLSALCTRFAQTAQEIHILAQPIKQPQPIVPASFALLPEQIEESIAGIRMTFFPALCELQGVVHHSKFATLAEAQYQHKRALQRLVLQELAGTAKKLRSSLPGRTELGLLYGPLGRAEALIEDILLASAESALLTNLPALPRTGKALAELAHTNQEHWVANVHHLAEQMLVVLQVWHLLQKRLKGRIELAQALALSDIQKQLQHLIYPGFVRETPIEWCTELSRYLKAILQRLDKLPTQLARDRALTIELTAGWERYSTFQRKRGPAASYDQPLQEYRWMLEEYRVSLFAQQLGTRMPISEKRLSKQWAEVTK